MLFEFLCMVVASTLGNVIANWLSADCEDSDDDMDLYG